MNGKTREISVIKNKLINLMLLLTFKILLEVSYILFVHPFYEYMGFTLRLNLIKLVESYMFMIFLFFLLPNGESKPSEVGTKLLFLTLIIPMLSLYALKDESRYFLYLFIGGFWLTLFTIQILPRIRLGKIRGFTYALYLGLSIITIVVYATLLKLNGMPTLAALNLNLVYEIRGAVKYGPSIMGYLVVWQGKVINPFLFGLSWYKRKYFLSLLIFGLQLLLFLFTGTKNFLFGPFLILFLIYGVQKKNILRLSLISLISLIIFSLVLFKINWNDILADIFIRRVFFVPAQNNFYYYDFFSKNQLVYLSESHLGSIFFEYPYDMPTPNMIGQVYYNSPKTWVNVSYLADAYMNFGSIGIFLFSFLLGILFVVMDSIALKTDKVVAISAMGRPIFSLGEGALFSVLGTSGLLFSMLVVWLYAEGTEGREKKEEARPCP